MTTPPSPRPPDPPRRLALLDGLILVAASAAGLALARSFLTSGRVFNPFNPGTNVTWSAYLSSYFVFGLGTRMASMLMLGLLAMDLRPPRPRLRRLFRRPGSVACLAAAATMAVNALEVGSWLVFRTVPIPGVWDPFGPVYSSRIGPAIMAAWAALWLGGRWRAEPRAVDRLGRLLGVFWLLFAGWDLFASIVLVRVFASRWAW